MIPAITSVDRRRFLQLMALGSGVVLAGCARAIPKLEPVAEVPDPTGALITRWRADEFARGSYSYLSLDSLPADRELLAAPISDTLFFAGEATSSSNPATVQGALISGRDAATKLYAVADPGAAIGVLGAGAAGIAAARGPRPFGPRRARRAPPLFSGREPKTKVRICDRPHPSRCARPMAITLPSDYPIVLNTLTLNVR